MTAASVMPSLEVRVDQRHAQAALAHVRGGLGSLLRVRFFDLLSHHRRSLLKHNKLPNRRGGQNFIGAFYRRFAMGGSEGRYARPAAIGEAFMAASGDEYTRGPGAFRLLEEGGTVRSAEPMAVPIGKWAKGTGLRTFRRLLKERGVRTVMRAGRPPLLVRDVGGRRARTDIVGVLTFTRKQPALLGFYTQWASVVPRHQAKLDRSLESLLTEAGRERLSAELSRVSAGMSEDTFVRRILNRTRKKADRLGAAVAAKANEPGTAGGVT